MKYKNVEDNFFVGQLLETVRREKGFTQVEVARQLGVPQGTLSKLESGILELSARLWHRFCSNMDIPLDTIAKGYVDRGLKVRFSRKGDSAKNTFRLKPKYQGSCHWNVRSVMPFIEFERENTSLKKFEDKLKGNKIFKGYFLGMDNLVNLTLLEDVVEEACENRAPFQDFLSEHMVSPRFHGDFHDDYLKSKSPIGVVKKYIANANKYSADYQRNIINETGNSIEIEMVKQSRFALDDFYGDYYGIFLKSLCLYTQDSISNINVETELQMGSGDRKIKLEVRV